MPDTGPVEQYRPDVDWLATVDDDDVTSGLQDAPSSHRRANTRRAHDHDDDGETTKERDERLVVESLFSSTGSSLEDLSERLHASGRRPAVRRPRPPAPGIAVDPDPTDVLRHRERVPPRDDDVAARRVVSVQRLAKLPRRREHAYDRRRRRRQHGRTKKHEHSRGTQQGRATSTSSRAVGSRSEHWPVDVVIRTVGSREHRPRRHRLVVLENSRRRRRRRRGAAGASGVGRRGSTDSRRHHTSRGRRSPPSDGRPTSADRSPGPARARRSLGHQRRRRDMDKQRQRAVLEKLIEATMTDAERTSRNLAPSRLDQLLGKPTGTTPSRSSGPNVVNRSLIGRDVSRHVHSSQRVTVT